MAVQTEPRDRYRLIAVAFFAVYGLLVCFAAWKHVFWRDEATAWLIARDSNSLHSLLHNLRYEGHPPLWHFMLYGITRWTSNPGWMKLPNTFCALATAALVLMARPVSLPVKAGFVLSYFLLFEYAVIDRNYMIGIMLIAAAAVMMTKKQASYAVPLLLSLAALTSLPALIVAVCLYGFHLNHERSLRGVRFLGLLLFASCSIASAAIIMPPSDSGVALAAGPRLGLLYALPGLGKSLADAYLPIPAFTYKFWGTQWSDSHGVLALLLGWFLFAAFSRMLKNKPARWFFIVANVLLLLQLSLTRRVFARHVGWLFIVLLVSLILESAMSAGNHSEPAKKPGWEEYVLYGVLAVQVIVGIAITAVSFVRPFSSSKQVARYLVEHHLEGAPLVVAPDYAGQAVLAYLERPTAYYVEREAEGSFVIWNRDEYLKRHVPTTQELASAARTGELPILLTEQPLSAEQVSQLNVAPMAQFTDAMCALDRYFLYRQQR